MASGSLAGAGVMSAGMAGVGAMFAFSPLRNLAKRWVWAMWGWDWGGVKGYSACQRRHVDCDAVDGAKGAELWQGGGASGF